MKRRRKMLEIKILIFSIICLWTGILPSVFGIKDGPTEVYSVVYSYRSGHVFITPGLSRLVDFFQTIGFIGCIIFILMPYYRSIEYRIHKLSGDVTETDAEPKNKYRFWYYWYYYTRSASIVNIIQVLFVVFVFVLKINLPEYIVIINVVIFICYIPANMIISSILNEESDMSRVVKNILYILFFIFTCTIGPSLVFLFRYDKLIKKMLYSNAVSNEGDDVIELTDIAEDDTKNADQKNRNR